MLQSWRSPLKKSTSGGKEDVTQKARAKKREASVLTTLGGGARASCRGHFSRQEKTEVAGRRETNSGYNLMRVGGDRWALRTVIYPPASVRKTKGPGEGKEKCFREGARIASTKQARRESMNGGAAWGGLLRGNGPVIAREGGDQKRT